MQGICLVAACPPGGGLTDILRVKRRLGGMVDWSVDFRSWFFLLLAYFRGFSLHLGTASPTHWLGG
ncbi:hypothetical protein ADIS_4657 [Lunatimonas lonarensis]|uniref:Uncharacterized protein n=1 Tax=Lunatimonas lonarensis TaxID=1232681 RepID=R7ZLK5_9BACT|nr:hypothetical protein [Lunatimonas lonarensis]EON74963.1 hypothetical protein ADIS_4657 [Lunatimonas lonarensis]